jgi:hemolysin D
MASRRAAFDELSRSVQEELTRARTRKGLLDTEPTRDGNKLTVTAPCAGTIVKLLVRSPGTVVHEFDPLAEIACGHERMQAELLVPQRGLARVTQGQPVKLRYDAFPYGRYGVRFATLSWISPAAAQTMAGQAFRALAELDDQSIDIEGTARPLSPGMSGDATVIVGQRTLVSYALEPLRAARERLSADRPSKR